MVYSKYAHERREEIFNELNRPILVRRDKKRADKMTKRLSPLEIIWIFMHTIRRSTPFYSFTVSNSFPSIELYIAHGIVNLHTKQLLTAHKIHALNYSQLDGSDH